MLLTAKNLFQHTHLCRQFFILDKLENIWGWKKLKEQIFSIKTLENIFDGESKFVIFRKNSLFQKHLLVIPLKLFRCKPKILLTLKASIFEFVGKASMVLGTTVVAIRTW